ncbi:MAG TPA: metalloregulator ArsR/SmtB family transcription factor [Aggregatilinea sp.]|uniref:ArsR/SmtB family transcription factor n=1 Tax=Aggregatilinea sp. TaxID=2806333 RepID=UPI002C374048|nr:metalloregulator ArsR/SmtB family transcription factor [Aggregatilinea sp.]HML21962.1 metalloregulator ArsR/SmtB family transcription factor [Aggregatilinea sp.]
MIEQSLAREVSQMEADLCSAFADPTRILILYALNDAPRNVGDLAEELDIPQSSTSRHLKVLKDRGLVRTVRQGTSVQYHLADPRLIEALDILRSILRDRLAHRASLMDEVE